MYQRELAGLSKVMAKLRTGRRVQPRQAEELPERQPILGAVTAVMARWNRSMTATEVLRAVEQQLGRPCLWIVGAELPGRTPPWQEGPIRTGRSGAVSANPAMSGTCAPRSHW